MDSTYQSNLQSPKTNTQTIFQQPNYQEIIVLPAISFQDQKHWNQFASQVLNTNKFSFQNTANSQKISRHSKQTQIKIKHPRFDHHFIKSICIPLKKKKSKSLYINKNLIPNSNNSQLRIQFSPQEFIKNCTKRLTRTFSSQGKIFGTNSKKTKEIGQVQLLVQMHRKAIIADRLISNMKPKRQSTIKRTIILKSIELRQSENSLKMINYEENQKDSLNIIARSQLEGISSNEEYPIKINNEALLLKQQQIKIENNKRFEFYKSLILKSKQNLNKSYNPLLFQIKTSPNVYHINLDLKMSRNYNCSSTKQSNRTNNLLSCYMVSNRNQSSGKLKIIRKRETTAR